MSFGSFLSVRGDVLRRVAEALVEIGMPAAIATGSTPPDELGPIPRRLARARLPPQVRLLSQARLAVTHGGNNSVTEAVGQGVPLLVLPFSTDQFAGAAAIERTGIGRALDPNAATVDELAAALTAVRDSVGKPVAAVDRARTGRTPRPVDRLRAADRPRARHELSHGDRVALGRAIALHERRVGVVMRTRPHLGGVVQGVDPALVPDRRLTEQGVRARGTTPRPRTPSRGTARPDRRARAQVRGVVTYTPEHAPITSSCSHSSAGTPARSCASPVRPSQRYSV